MAGVVGLEVRTVGGVVARMPSGGSYGGWCSS